MRHQGVAFPPEYEPRGLAIKIKDTTVKLEPLQEEMLMAWAKKIGTPYVEDPVFQENFLASLRERWQDVFDGVTLGDIDFGKLSKIAAGEKLANLPPQKRQKVSAERKKIREELKAQYGHAEVDGLTVEVGAYLVEPPGIFMGRGAHPLRGRWKPRVLSSEVTLNLDEDAPAPTAPHGEWKEIVHEHDGLWIARWLDPLSDKIKYVWLAETSHLRQEREQEKFVKAESLKAGLANVRGAIGAGMRDEDIKKRKVATVAYLIDNLAMRVGDEKDEDEADTVGASTLRVEHVKFFADHVEFDFLGKDSVRWEKDLAISGANDQLAKNLREFAEGKQPAEQLFPEITSSKVNEFLKNAMPGLTAKVFRTYHATTTVADFLDQQKQLKPDAPPYEKEHVAKLANLAAAITCNHKRTPPKTWAESLAKREAAVKKLRAARPDLTRFDARLNTRETALKKLLEAQAKFEADAPRVLEQKETALAQLDAKPAPRARKGRGNLRRRLEAAKRALREWKRAQKDKGKHLRARIQNARDTLERARAARKRAKSQYHERLSKAERQLELAKRTRDYNLNTSLKNYIDPRVYRQWGEAVDFDWKRLYTGALLRKFKWALEERTGAGGEDRAPLTETSEGSGPLTASG